MSVSQREGLQVGKVFVLQPFRVSSILDLATFPIERVGLAVTP